MPTSSEKRAFAPCSIEGCQRTRSSRGLCNTHYERWRKNGDPLKTLPPNGGWNETHGACKRGVPYSQKTEAQKEVLRACARRWKAKPGNREKSNERAAAWRAKNRHKLAEMYRRETLKQYGLTPAAFEEMMRTQGGVCAICKTAPDRTKTRDGRVREKLSVDHDHDTGMVRGLLCDRCNIGIGYMKNDPAKLRAAAEYLERCRRS